MAEFSGGLAWLGRGHKKNLKGRHLVKKKKLNIWFKNYKS